jgi:hypothetical protein
MGPVGPIFWCPQHGLHCRLQQPVPRPSKWSVLGGLPPEKWSWHGGLPVRRGGRGAQAAPGPPRDSTPVTFLTTWCAIYVMACTEIKKKKGGGVWFIVAKGCLSQSPLDYFNATTYRNV